MKNLLNAIIPRHYTVPYAPLNTFAVNWYGRFVPCRPFFVCQWRHNIAFCKRQNNMTFGASYGDTRSAYITCWIRAAKRAREEFGSVHNYISFITHQENLPCKTSSTMLSVSSQYWHIFSGFPLPFTRLFECVVALSIPLDWQMMPLFLHSA